ncbi:MAG: cobaltochelatase CobN [Clostridia bacterium]|nr:cobaltochelatase CobN [Clostridia bacterium]
MKKCIIVVIGFDSEQDELVKVSTTFKFMQMKFFPGSFLEEKKQRQKVLDYVKQQARAVIIKDHYWNGKREDFYQKLKSEAGTMPIIPISTEMIEAGIFNNVDLTSIQEINRYFIFGGSENLTNALHYIGNKVLGIVDVPPAAKPVPVAFEGIFHPDSEMVFTSWESYSQWYQTCQGSDKGPWVGLLIHRNSWVTDNLEVEKALINELEQLGLRIVPVFSYGPAGPELNTKDFDDITKDYFSCNDRLVIDALINLQVFALRSGNTGRNLFGQAVDKMKKLNIPVFRPLISFMSSKENWEENQQGLMLEIPWAFTVPEIQGMIEPIIIGCRDKKGKAHPIPDRVNKFARRVKKWIELKHTPTQEKKLAIFIHNAPCSGVEATIGMGAGLDVFDTTVMILKKLQNQGWTVENIPEDGSKLHRLIMERKAYSDFRWTSVEDILDSHGCLHQMPLQGDQGYYQYYKKLDPRSQEEMEKTWGPPPGEGMVYDNHLIITGVNFGNITVLVQPKRGCYGAKCTGEVCKILQDPNCPPPHHYLATYKYVEEILKAHAVLHIGTHGSLEFLPGKVNALSKKCYPDMVLGTLPNFYIYNAGVGTEGILAKRRTNAVILDHLPSIYGVRDTEVLQLINLITEYLDALSLRSGQIQELETQIREQVLRIPGAKTVLDRAETFYQGLQKLKKILVQSVCNPQFEKLHVYGGEITQEDALWYIKEVLQSDVKLITCLRKQWQDDYDLHHFLNNFIIKAITLQRPGSIIAEEICHEMLDKELKNILDDLSVEVREIYSRLTLVPNEMDNLIKALNGGYVSPGPSGMPDDNGKNIIPTGRNFYLMDIEKIPTRAAWEVGCKLADQLIEVFVADEGHYPEKVAMNMISLDISRTKGEQLSQILYLMGIKPMWDGNGKVIDLEVIPLEQLKRPRIDVTVRISGVLRDCYPEAVELIDTAVCKAAALSEPDDLNYIKKHTLKIAQVLQDMEESERKRHSTIRIFGDPPGSYGAGVDLALKASAWKDETDLAKTFVYFSSYAYGKSLNGKPATREFVENVKRAQLAYDVAISKRCDMLSCSFGASVQGGFGLVRKVLEDKSLKQYHGSRENPEQVEISPLDEKLRETLDKKLFNPLWKESMKEKGYRGAAELMERLQNVFEWQCLTQSFEDNVLDRLVEEYINDPKMREWFLENNPFAIEEIARRFLELYQREKWQADHETLKELKSNYLELEGEMEERLGEVKGEIQAGTIEVMNDADVKEWQDKLKQINVLFTKYKRPIR